MRGLLTRSQLSGGPEFGITTKANSALDQYHEAIQYTILDVFGLIKHIFFGL